MQRARPQSTNTHLHLTKISDVFAISSYPMLNWCDQLRKIFNSQIDTLFFDLLGNYVHYIRLSDERALNYKPSNVPKARQFFPTQMAKNRKKAQRV